MRAAPPAGSPGLIPALVLPLAIWKFARYLPPAEGWRFPGAAGGERAGIAVRAVCVCVCVCVCARLLCLSSPSSAERPAGGRASSPPSAARHTRASARPRRPSAHRGAHYRRGANRRPGGRAPVPGRAVCGGRPRCPGRAVPAVPAGRWCGSGPRLAVPAGPAPSWLPGMNMHGPPSSSSSSCMCVCVCGERGSASSAAPAMSARLRLGPP